MPKLRAIQVARPDNTIVVESILDELDLKRVTNTERESLSVGMVEERHYDKDSWLTALIEGTIISR